MRPRPEPPTPDDLRRTVPKCDHCGRRLRIRMLISTDSSCDHDVYPFLFCSNIDCPKGPRVIRSLSDGA